MRIFNSCSEYEDSNSGGRYSKLLDIFEREKGIRPKVFIMEDYYEIDTMIPYITKYSGLL